MADGRCEPTPLATGPQAVPDYFRCRMRERMRRFLRPTFRRPLPRRRAPIFSLLQPTVSATLGNRDDTGAVRFRQAAKKRTLSRSLAKRGHIMPANNQPLLLAGGIGAKGIDAELAGCRF